MEEGKKRQPNGSMASKALEMSQSCEDWGSP